MKQLRTSRSVIVVYNKKGRRKEQKKNVNVRVRENHRKKIMYYMHFFNMSHAKQTCTFLHFILPLYHASLSIFMNHFMND